MDGAVSEMATVSEDAKEQLFLKQALALELKQELKQAFPLALPSRLPALQAALDDLKSVCAGYLGTGKTMQAFYRYLQLSGLDPQCHFREKFWQAYFQAGYIVRSWLVLAPQAEGFFRKEFNFQSHQYGRLLQGQGVVDHEAVLILRLERLVVAEWSHGRGSFFWLQSHLHLPQLFHCDYESSELFRYAAYAQKHYFATKGLWQKDAMAWMSAKAHIPALWVEG